MNENRYFFTQTALEHATTRVLVVLFDEGIDFFLRERCENLDVALCFFIAYVEPELVEGVRRSAVAVEPYVTLLSLTKLLTVGLSDEGTRKRERLSFTTKGAVSNFSMRERCVFTSKTTIWRLWIVRAMSIP